MPRDGFSKAVARRLADSAGHLCAKCKCHTVGPNANVGVAAHIRAASPGGARYDPGMTPAQRKDISNGIWLCQTHAKEIDDDERTFTVPMLERMKAQHEADVAERVTSGRTNSALPSDDEILAAFSRILDRPAMSEPFGDCHQPEFQKAVTDMIEALNTGVHRLRDGTVIKQTFSRHDLRGKTEKDALEAIVRSLLELRALHARLVEAGKVNPGCGCTQGQGVAAPLDALRSKILELFRAIHPAFSVYLAQRPAQPPTTSPSG